MKRGNAGLNSRNVFVTRKKSYKKSDTPFYPNYTAEGRVGGEPPLPPSSPSEVLLPAIGPLFPQPVDRTCYANALACYKY